VHLMPSRDLHSHCRLDRLHCRSTRLVRRRARRHLANAMRAGLVQRPRRRRRMRAVPRRDFLRYAGPRSSCAVCSGTLMLHWSLVLALTSTQGSFNGRTGQTSCCLCCAGWYAELFGQTQCSQCGREGFTSQGYSFPGSVTRAACLPLGGAQSTCSQTGSGTCRKFSLTPQPEPPS
jgi:hypothetical protein